MQYSPVEGGTSSLVRGLIFVRIPRKNEVVKQNGVEQPADTLQDSPVNGGVSSLDCGLIFVRIPRKK